MPLSLRRSALYMPANNQRAVDKARSLPVDMVILDLEDSVAPDAKDAARRGVIDALNTGGYAHREMLVRTSAPGSDGWQPDTAILSACRPDGVLVPKIDTPADVFSVCRQLDRLDPDGEVDVWLMMETPASVLNAAAIGEAAAAESRVQGFAIGTNDLVKDTGVSDCGVRQYLLPWILHYLLVARVHGLVVLDGVFNDFRDQDGYAAECRQGRDLGMDGKTLIHPSQIALCNQLFSPSPDAVAEAQRIVDAFSQPGTEGLGVLNIDGRMVERLHLSMAERLLDRYRRLQELEPQPSA